MGKSAKMTVKTPETSTGNEHHCRGEKPKNQTQSRAPKKGSRRSHEGGSTNGQTGDRTPQRRNKLVTKSEIVKQNDIDDEGYLLHQSKRRKKAPTVPPCCTCTRSSTCSTTVGRPTIHSHATPLLRGGCTCWYSVLNYSIHKLDTTQLRRE